MRGARAGGQDGEERAGGKEGRGARRPQPVGAGPPRRKPKGKVKDQTTLGGKRLQTRRREGTGGSRVTRRKDSVDCDTGLQRDGRSVRTKEA